MRALRSRSRSVQRACTLHQEYPTPRIPNTKKNTTTAQNTHRTNSSRRSSIKISFTPAASAFFLAGSSSSPCPKSAVNVTTSQSYSSCNHFNITDVSNPPEYARTTLFTLDLSTPDGESEREAAARTTSLEVEGEGEGPREERERDGERRGALPAERDDNTRDIMVTTTSTRDKVLWWTGGREGGDVSGIRNVASRQWQRRIGRIRTNFVAVGGDGHGRSPPMAMAMATWHPYQYQWTDVPINSLSNVSSSSWSLF